MHDRISNYRQVRLVLQVPPEGYGTADWSLHLVDTRRGVPHASVIASGRVSMVGGRPDVPVISQALQEAVGVLQGQ